MVTRWLGFLTIAAATSTCLQGGVPFEERQFIKDDQGLNMAVGFLRCDWASAYLLNEITVLLVQEAVGFHAETHPIVGRFGASPFFALAGCENFDDPQNRRCGEKETRVHVAMDAWIGGYMNTYLQFQDDQPLIAPIDVGNQGYLGEESIWISNSVLHDAFTDAGIVLDYYKTWNVSGASHKRYFDDVRRFPLEEFITCEQSLFNDPVTMTNYAKFAGDPDGVLPQDDGTFVAKCMPDRRWWASPMCRETFPECIPLLTAGTGWSLQSLMQKATAYGIPAAIATSSNYSQWTSHVQTHRLMWYWWVPDSTFIELAPEPIIFPRHSPSGWAKGDKASGSESTYVAKMVSSNLKRKASKVQDFVSNVVLELDEIMELLLEAKVKGSMEDTACRWVRDNRERWQQWIASETSCTEGHGLVSLNGAFVRNRSQASSCQPCAAGHFSEAFADEGGKTHRCLQCSPGYSQAQSSSTACEPCDKGSLADQPGSIECQPCGVGFYQNSSAQTSCIPCSKERTTQLLGANQLDACVCKANYIEDELKMCRPCGEGLFCPLGSTLKGLMGNDGSIPELSPAVKEGYRSNKDTPKSIYKCVDMQCPGGQPGSCSGGHQGITCAKCEPKHYSWAGGECQRCGVGAEVAWPIVCIVVVIGVFISYYALSFGYVAKAGAFFCAAASFGITFGLFQNLGVLSTAVSWEGGEMGLLQVASIFVFNLDGFGFSCAAEDDSVRYGLTASFFWIVLIAFPILGVITNFIPTLRRRRLNWKFMKTLNVMGHFLQTASTTMASFGLLPFMCYDHPNGQQSVLKYSSTLCGSADHISMTIIGASLFVLSLSFFALCCFAARQAPSWSMGSPSVAARLTGIVFLIQRFRPSKWWFGLILLARGQLLSLPVVFATNMPSLHLILMLCIQQLYTNFQLWYQPWKSPILNLGDATSTSLLVSLLAVLLACLESCNGIMLNLRWAVAASLVASLGLLVIITSLNFIWVVATGKQLRVVNLGARVDSQRVMDGLWDIHEFLGDQQIEQRKDEMLSGLSQLCTYDLQSVLEAIDVLVDDWQLAVTAKMAGRISASVSSNRAKSTTTPKAEDQKKKPRSARVSILAYEGANLPDMQALEADAEIPVEFNVRKDGPGDLDDSPDASVPSEHSSNDTLMFKFF